MQVDEEWIQTEANKIKDLVIATLAKEGLLKGNLEDIASDYVIVLSKKGKFGIAFDKFFKSDNEIRYTFLKTLKSNKPKFRIVKYRKEKQK